MTQDNRSPQKWQIERAKQRGSKRLRQLGFEFLSPRPRYSDNLTLDQIAAIDRQIPPDQAEKANRKGSANPLPVLAQAQRDCDGLSAITPEIRVSANSRRMAENAPGLPLRPLQRQGKPGARGTPPTRKI